MKLSFEASRSERGSFVQVSWGSLAAILIFVFQKPWRVNSGNLKARYNQKGFGNKVFALSH